MDITPQGVEQAAAGLDQPAVVLDTPEVTPTAGTDVTAAGPSEAEMQAMAEMFPDMVEDDHQATPAEGDGAEPTDTDQAAQRQSADTPWEDMTPEEQRAGHMRQADYTRKTQELAALRKQTETQLQQLQSQQQQLLQMQQQLLARQTQPQDAQQPQQPQAPVAPNSDDFVDDEGFLDVGAFVRANNEYLQQATQYGIETALQAKLTPIQETLTQRQQREQQAQEDSLRSAFLAEATKLEAAFPHFAQVKEQVAKAIMDSGAAPDPAMLRVYYAQLFPQQYDARRDEYRRALAAKKSTPTQGPSLAPGRRTNAQEAAPSDPAARLQAMAADFQRGG